MRTYKLQPIYYEITILEEMENGIIMLPCKEMQKHHMLKQEIHRELVNLLDLKKLIIFIKFSLLKFLYLKNYYLIYY